MKSSVTKRFLRSYTEGRMDIIKNVDDKINSMLNHDESRKFRTLIKSYYKMSRKNIEDCMVYYKNMDKDYQKRIDDSKTIYEFYDKLDVNDKDIELHWTYYRYIQSDLHSQYKSVAKLPRQDNKSYINYGSGSGSYPTIRYPSKKRKTAWKRFYKLFPHLDPKNKKI